MQAVREFQNVSHAIWRLAQSSGPLGYGPDPAEGRQPVTNSTEETGAHAGRDLAGNLVWLAQRAVLRIAERAY
jgi:hypothetical protein